MPRKNHQTNEEKDPVLTQNALNFTELTNLNRMLAAVLEYLSDDEVEEIDIEYLLKNTEGLREWWEQYREKNRRVIEDEIKNALADLSLGELESIRDKIKEKDSFH